MGRDRLRTVEIAIAIGLATAWALFVSPGPLSLPYFWDEADVYVPGAKWVAEHGLVVTPGVLPDDYSRGHPPLLYLLGGAAFRVFGPEPLVGHLCVLPFTIAALAGTYLLGAAAFGRPAGLASASLFACTPLALSMGRMLLPEMPLTALGVLSLFAFARGRLGLAVLCGVIAVWIKETGIFVAAGVGVGVLVDAWQRGELRSRRTIRHGAIAALPLIALGAFFAWQKLTAGYFVFPHHQDLFADRPFEPSNALTVFPSLIVWNGRWIALAAALVAAIAARVEVRAALAEPPEGSSGPRRGAIAAACLAPVVFYAIFFAKMFWLDRYALPAHPGLLVVAGAVLPIGARKWISQERLRAVFIGAPITVACVLGMIGMWSATPPDAEERTFAYADVIATHRSAFVSLGPIEGPVLTTWPLTIELRNPYLGYVEEARETVHVDQLTPQTPIRAVIVSTASWRADELRAIARERGLRRRSTHRVGLSRSVEVWR